MRSEEFSFNLGPRVELCLADVVFEFATVCNRPQPFATVRMMPLWPCRWGELLRATCHGCVTLQMPLLHCNLRKKSYVAPER